METVKQFSQMLPLAMLASPWREDALFLGFASGELHEWSGGRNLGAWGPREHWCHETHS